jgi:hypothetical protein
MRRLLLAPPQGVGLLGKQLFPVPAGEVKRLVQLVEELKSPRLVVRQAAAAELEKLGRSAAPALRCVLRNRPDLEWYRRVEQLLLRLRTHPYTPEELRQQRAIEVLERIGNQEAQALLQRLATGAPEAALTERATRALVRLKALRGAGGPPAESPRR